MLTAVVIALGIILILLAFVIIYGIYHIIDKLESIQVNVQNLNDISNSIDLLNNRIDHYFHIHKINNRP